jgi:pyrimidine-nucleoside phosphorylase
VPADKKIYALRDITGTVDCIPLIAASVMSKKIASGADAIVLDVKAGCGAFMKTVPEAAELARAMVEIGRLAGKDMAAAITDMEQPLGRAVGNALEVREAIETLKGAPPSPRLRRAGGSDDLVELSAVLGGLALVLGRKAANAEEGESIIRNRIADGSGAAKLREIIEAQGGNPAVVDDLSLLPTAPVRLTVNSPAAGYVTKLDAMRIAQAATALGAGREEAGATPDLSVGIRLLNKTGEPVSAGEPLAEVHAKDGSSAEVASKIVLDAYAFGQNPPVPRPLVRDIVR